jgi:hypothetical protein
MTTLLMLFMLSSNVLWRIDLFTAYDIGRIPDVVVNHEGEIGILDVAGSKLHVLNADGQHIGSYGNKGQGPGEFNYGSNLFYSYAHACFAVFDQGRQKLILWRDGSPKEIKVGGIRSSNIVQNDPRGVYWLKTPLYKEKSKQLFVVFSGFKGESKPVYHLPDAKHIRGLPVSDTQWLFFTHDHQGLIAGGSDFVAAAWTDAPVVYVIRNETVVSIEVPFAAVPVLPRQEKAIKASFSGHWVAIQRAYKDRVLPYFTALLVDTHDHLWVFGQPTDDAYPYVQYDTSGQQLSTGTMATLPLAIGHGYSLSVTGEDPVLHKSRL